MLAPRSRRLLLDALRPPPGYQLDRAVGTSYSLDLLALMTAPLAFTFFDWEDVEGRPTADPLALLEAVRRHADRISLFCQTGRISVPGSGRALLLYLEGSVFEVAARQKHGLFHPKIWLLRYTADDEPVRFRLLCLSRNLTFDRSWDTALVLDGQLEDRKNAFAANHPLGEFVAALPGLAVRGVPAKTRTAVERMSDEVRKVRFELPEGFDDYAFWPLGLDRRRVLPFPENGRRMLVVSPFLGGDFLKRVSNKRPEGVLISRPESLCELEPQVLEGFEEVLVLNPDSDPEEADDEAAGESAGELPPEADGTALSGLHAKLYVVDDGWGARVWTGSANATKAAFDRNVEFLVELSGKKKFCGIDQLLGDEDGSEASLRAMLLPFQAPHDPREGDKAQEALEKALDRARIELGKAQLRAKAAAIEGGQFSLSVVAEGDLPDLPKAAKVTFRPVTLGPGMAVTPDWSQAEVARFPPVTFEALTGFFAIELSLREAGREGTARFVVNLPLEGAPPDRRERLLRSILKDSTQVLRLIWLLLSEADISVQEWVDAGTGASRWKERRQGTEGEGGFPILETMLKALDRDPAKLDAVARLVADLRRTPEGAALLPCGFDEIWDPIWRTREELRR